MAFSQPAGPNAASEDARLERIASHAAVGLFEADCSGSIRFATARCREILGLDEASIVGHAWLCVIVPEDRARLEQIWSGDGGPTELQVGIEGDAERTARIWLSPIEGESGLRSGFAGAITDITEFAKAAAKLSASLDQFRVVAEAMPHLAWVAGTDGTIEYFNQPWLQYTGLTVERMKDGLEKGVVHPSDLAMTWQRWTESLASGKPYEIEYRLRSVRDGTYRWFIARAVPIRNDSGHIVHWIGTATDIDAQVRANANLRFTLDAASVLAPLLDVRDICNELARLATARIADWCFITLVDEAGEYRTATIAHRDPARTRFLERFNRRHPLEFGSPLDDAIHKHTSTLIPSVDPALISRITDDPKYLRMLERSAIHSLMVVPIITDSGATSGAITLLSLESAHTFTQEDLAVVEMVARRAAAAIQTANAYGEERARVARLRFIARASELIFQSFDLQATFDGVTELIVSEVADLAFIMLVENGTALRTVSAAHRSPDKAHIADRLRGQRTLRPHAEEVALHTLAGGQPQLHPHVAVQDVLPLVWEYLTPDVRALDIRSGITIPLRSRGETFGALAVYWCESERAYAQDDIPIFEDLGRRISIAIEHARTLERERGIAQALQHALLPQPGALPVTAGLSFSAEYRSSSREADVGGDWYDAVAIPDGSIAISVGDVTGRGLRAAGLMGKLRQALGMACLYERDPARILDSVDFSIRTPGSTAMATAFLGIISPDRKMMRYAGAGHPPPLLRRNNKLVELRSRGLPLGLRDADREESTDISLEGAQLLLLYTDGLTEATRDLAFGERRLRLVASSEAILYVRSPARFICDACLPREAQDDTAVLTLRFGEGTQWSFDAENARAAHEARVELIANLRAHAAAAGDFEAAELVFGELVGNVVRHAPGPIDVQIDWCGEYPILHVTDRGKGTLRKPSLPANPLSESGRGLYIISLLTRSLRVERIPGYGNHIVAELNLRRAER